jgi:hypothetical protein
MRLEGLTYSHDTFSSVSYKTMCFLFFLLLKCMWCLFYISLPFIWDCDEMLLSGVNSTTYYHRGRDFGSKQNCRCCFRHAPTSHITCIPMEPTCPVDKFDKNARKHDLESCTFFSTTFFSSWRVTLEVSRIEVLFLAATPCKV